MDFIVEFLPLIAFFAVYKYKLSSAAEGDVTPFIHASIVLVIATVICMAINWIKNKKVSKTQLVSLIIVMIFGGFTIYLKDPFFLKIRPTIAYSIFALTLIISQLIKKPVIKMMLSKVFNLPDEKWGKMTALWSVFFIFLAILNLIVFPNLSENAWVNYKLFGVSGSMLVFIMCQGVMLKEYMPDLEESDDDKDADSESKAESESDTST